MCVYPFFHFFWHLAPCECFIVNSEFSECHYVHSCEEKWIWIYPWSVVAEFAVIDSFILCQATNDPYDILSHSVYVYSLEESEAFQILFSQHAIQSSNLIKLTNWLASRVASKHGVHFPQILLSHANPLWLIITTTNYITLAITIPRTLEILDRTCMYGLQWHTAIVGSLYTVCTW